MGDLGNGSGNFETVIQTGRPQTSTFIVSVLNSQWWVSNLKFLMLLDGLTHAENKSTVLQQASISDGHKSSNPPLVNLQMVPRSQGIPVLMVYILLSERQLVEGQTYSGILLINQIADGLGC